MKATLTSVLLLLFTGAVLAQAPQADVAAQEASFYAGVLDTTSLRAAVERSTARADAHLKALVQDEDLSRYIL